MALPWSYHGWPRLSLSPVRFFMALTATSSSSLLKASILDTSSTTTPQATSITAPSGNWRWLSNHFLFFLLSLFLICMIDSHLLPHHLFLFVLLLQHDTKYYYAVGIGHTVRKFWFTTPPKVGPDVPYTFGLIGIFFLILPWFMSLWCCIAACKSSPSIAGDFWSSY